MTSQAEKMKKLNDFIKQSSQSNDGWGLDDDETWLVNELKLAWRQIEMMDRTLRTVALTHKHLYPKSTENFAQQTLDEVEKMK
jgi:hypothetical protein